MIPGELKGIFEGAVGFAALHFVTSALMSAFAPGVAAAFHGASESAGELLKEGLGAVGINIGGVGAAAGHGAATGGVPLLENLVG